MISNKKLVKGLRDNCKHVMGVCSVCAAEEILSLCNAMSDLLVVTDKLENQMLLIDANYIKKIDIARKMLEEYRE